jgi:formylglycine-generating enzyme required for sulfatase activity
LPSKPQWQAAAAAIPGPYPFGERFRPKWFSSCFTRTTPRCEPVMSFPIDQSVFGVYDLTGSVSEWLEDTWLPGGDQKTMKGGSWAHGGPEDRFRVDGGTGVIATFTDGTTGFRLVLTMETAGEPAP